MTRYRRPGIAEMTDQVAFRQAVMLQQAGGAKRGSRTSLSMSGDRQLNATAYSLSDIMQGTMAVNGPQDTNLIINKALSEDLDKLYRSDYSAISAFSTAKYVPVVNEGHDTTNGASNFGSSSDSTDSTTDGAAGFGPVGDAISGVNITVYSPQTGGDAIEGGLESARSGLDGKALVRTLDDVRAGTSTYVTLAGDPSLYKKQYTIPTITYDSYVSGSKESVTLTQVTAYVHDTGGAFIGKPEGRYDVAVGKNYTNKQMNSQPFANYGPPVTEPKIQLIPWGSTGGTGTGGSLGEGNQGNAIAELRKAQVRLANHPNNWMVNSGQYAAGFRRGLENGFPPNVVDGSNVNPLDYVLFKENGKCFLFPALINYLWHIMENGFLLGDYLGAIGFKHIRGTNKVSNHSSGGAIDIGAIGIASEGKIYSIPSSDGRRVGERMFTMLSTLPPNNWADEHGWHVWRVNFGSGGFHTYPDEGHIHLGFDESRPGTLMSSLRN